MVERLARDGVLVLGTIQTLIAFDGTQMHLVLPTDEEVRDAAHYLRHRAIVALARASEMQRTSLEDVFHQAVLEFKETG